MILSHKHKFIFVKTMKTAGTSIQIALAPHCGKQDIITPIDSRIAPPEYKHQNDAGFQSHMGIHEIKERVPPNVFKGYHKFSIVRNPWDTVVSQYYFRAKMRRVKSDFATWCQTNWRDFPDNLSKLSINYNLAVNQIIRFEDLPDAFLAVCERLGIKGVELPHYNSTLHAQYKDHYSDLTQQLVRQRYLRDIQLFGYDF